MGTRPLDSDVAVQHFFELRRLLGRQRGAQDRAAETAEPLGNHFRIARLNPSEDECATQGIAE